MKNNAIIDANINRVSEGLRVIEEFTRFTIQEKPLTDRLSKLRKEINITESYEEGIAHLMVRDTDQDVRAKEIPQKRLSIYEVLKANFKRVEEGLRVLEEYTGNNAYNQCRYECYELEKEIVLRAIKPELKNGIYLISDKVDVLEKGLKEGVAIIQLRDKSGTKSEIFEKAKQVKRLSENYNIPFIINDFIDIALLIDADGLHTGQDDISVTELRKILGPHKILGRTTHNIDQGKQAQVEGADYVSVGPIWEAPSKQIVRAHV